MYLRVSTQSSGARWHEALMRWRSCSIAFDFSSVRSSGWPTRKLCSSAWLPSWKFDSMRSSSIDSCARFCASSMISSARLPSAASEVRKASIVEMRCAFESVVTGTPKAMRMARSRSPAASWLLTICAATTLLESSPSSSVRTTVVLPAPISPVTTMKPSPWCAPYLR